MEMQELVGTSGTERTIRCEICDEQTTKNIRRKKEMEGKKNRTSKENNK